MLWLFMGQSPIWGYLGSQICLCFLIRFWNYAVRPQSGRRASADAHNSTISAASRRTSSSQAYHLKEWCRGTFRIASYPRCGCLLCVGVCFVLGCGYQGRVCCCFSPAGVCRVKQADEHEILQVGAYAAKVDPRCADLRLATGDPRTVGYPLTSDTRLTHTTDYSPFVDPSRRLACTTPLCR